MYKDFFTLEDLKLDADFKENICKLSLQEFTSYLNIMPESEKNKYNIFKTYRLLMCTLMIKFSTFKVYEEESEKDLFNFFFNVPTDHTLSINSLIRDVVTSQCDLYQLYDYSQCKIHFQHTLSYIESVLKENFHSSHYMLYHNGANILPHSHSDGILTCHFLLEDIIDGVFTVGVGKSVQTVSKAGDYFIFDPNIIHYGNLNGKSALFLMVNIPNYIKPYNAHL